MYILWAIMKEQTIERSSLFSIIWTALISRELRRPGFRLFGTILRYFFFYQFQTAFRFKKRPIVNVDHPLDREIPFCPEDVKKYLSFISLWMKSLSFYRRTGGKAANRRTVEYITGLTRLYRQAGMVYDKCQSTTGRPGPGARPRFVLIHLFDPHLHCVPSLHVGVVLYNWFMMKGLLGERLAKEPGLAERPDFAREISREVTREIAYARTEALAIIDTILTIKQHSINCVASGLYFLGALFPEDFSRDDGRGVIAGLLEGRKDEIPRLPEIRGYILELYEDLWTAHHGTEPGLEPDPRKVLLDFLKEYAPALEG